MSLRGLKWISFFSTMGLVVAIACVYWASLSSALVFDSFNVLQSYRFKDISLWFSLSDALSMVRYVGKYILGNVWHAIGMKPEVYKALNLALHTLNSCLVFLCFRHIFNHRSSSCQQLNLVAAFFSSLFFAVNGLGVFAVAYVAQFDMLLAVFFCLCSFYSFIKIQNLNGILLSICCYVLALYSKETVIFFPLVLWVYWPFTSYKVSTLFKATALMWLCSIPMVLWVLRFIGQSGEANLSLAVSQAPRVVEGGSWGISVVQQCEFFFQYLFYYFVPIFSELAIDLPRVFPKNLGWTWVYAVLYLCWGVSSLKLIFKKNPGLIGFFMIVPWVLFTTELVTVRFNESFVLYRTYFWMMFSGGALGLLILSLKNHFWRRLWMVNLVFFLIGHGYTVHRQLEIWQSPTQLWEQAVINLPSDSTGVPTAYRGYANLGRALAHGGNLEKAAGFYKKATELQPLEPQLWYDLGFVHFSKQDLKSAQQALEKSIEIKPDFKKAIELLGEVYLKQNMLLKAEQLYQKHKVQINYAELWYQMAQQFIEKKDWVQAQKYLEKAVKKSPQKADYWLNLGKIQQRQGNIEKAYQSYKKAVAADENLAEALDFLGQMSLRQKNPKEALSYFLRALNNQPPTGALLLNLGIAYWQDQQWDKAALAFEKASELAPGLSKVYLNYGHLLAQQQKNQEALQQYQKAIHEDARYSLALYSAGLICLRLQKPDEARYYFEQTLIVDPGFVQAQTMLDRLKIKK